MDKIFCKTHIEIFLNISMLSPYIRRTTSEAFKKVKVKCKNNITPGVDLDTN